MPVNYSEHPNSRKAFSSSKTGEVKWIHTLMNKKGKL